MGSEKSKLLVAHFDMLPSMVFSLRYLHQTQLSRAVKRIPGLNVLAEIVWIRYQEKLFFGSLAPLLNSSDRPAGDGGHIYEILSNIRIDSPKNKKLANDFEVSMSSVSSSDKFFNYGYQKVYGPLLSELRNSAPRLLEIGIGVADPSAPSGMSESHIPGTSLMGWSSYFGRADIHGADVDMRVLKDTDWYRTHFVDQLSERAMMNLAEELAPVLDIVIDDGLHTPAANGATVSTFLPLLSNNGLLVVEDILPRYDSLWERLQTALPADYYVRFFSSAELGGPSGLAVFCRR